MGLIGAAFGLGFMLGPAMGGLLSLVSLSAPAFVAAALVLSSVVFGYFRLPESLPVERRAQQLQSINPFKRLRAVIGLEVIRPFLLGVVMLNFAFAGLQSNFAVFANTRFGFGPTDIAFVFAFIGLVAVVMQGFLIRRLAPRFGEARLAVSGLTLMALAFGMIAFVPAGWMLYPATAVLAIGSSMATPSLTSLISRRVSPQAQGSALGGVQALNSLMMVVGPLFAGVVFDAFGPVLLVVTGAAGVLTLGLRSDLGRSVPVEQGAPVEAERMAAQ
jgi:MFS family permease